MDASSLSGRASRRVQKDIRRLIEEIKNGLTGPDLKAEWNALQERKTALQAKLESADEPPPFLHPGMAELYRQKVTGVRLSLLAAVDWSGVRWRRYKPSYSCDGRPAGALPALMQRVGAAAFVVRVFCGDENRKRSKRLPKSMPFRHRGEEAEPPRFGSAAASI